MDRQEQENLPQKESKQKKENDDFAMSGMIFTFILLAVLGFMIYLLTVKGRSKVCVPGLDANGQVTNNCTPSAVSPVPAQGGAPGQIKFLPGLNQQKLPQIDGQ